MSPLVGNEVTAKLAILANAFNTGKIKTHYFKVFYLLGNNAEE
jgi:hypothetical protein